MKKTLGIGNFVDDGTGDYLRLGGEKINNNFSDLYDELGDGQVPYPAGAWKTHNRGALSPKFGQSFNINTTTASVTVTLPEGQPSDYGRVIKLRDVWGTWTSNPVTLVATGNNTIKGGSTPAKLYRDLQDVELVFVSPGNWEYLDNKLVSRISNSDGATVAKKEFIATQGQTDFQHIFGEAPYNSNNIEVYRRGNMLYYGDDFSDSSDYGSFGATTGDLAPLDGKTLRLRLPCNEGDTITVVTYLDDVAVYKTSYMSRTIQVYGLDYDGTIDPADVPGQIWIGDLSTKKNWTLLDLGFHDSDGQINPFSVEVQINGRNLTKAGTANLPSFVCETATGDIDLSIPSENSCTASGGTWGESGIDFSVVRDAIGRFNIVKIQEKLESGDMLTVKWFNNDIGTTMDWEEIKTNADNFYLNNEYRFARSNRIRYNNRVDPTPRDVEIVQGTETNIKFSDISSLLDSIYPIGTVYQNAHNKANPADYMGFGQWIPYAQGKAIVGWNDDNADSNFGHYTDATGSLLSPGGTGGNVQHEIKANEVPQVSSTDKVLIKDANGDVIIGQCLDDPGGAGPGYRKYREDTLNSNVNMGGVNISLLQPYVTVSVWLRVG